MTIQQVRVGVPSKISLAQIEIQFKPNEFGDYNSVEIEGQSLLFPSKYPFPLSVSQIAATGGIVLP